MTEGLDIITLENLEVKLSRWDPLASNHLHALVDMGSNGIRFSISDLALPTTRLLRCVYRERAAISLFDALVSSASSAIGNDQLAFSAETIVLVSNTLARFRSIAVDDFGVPVEHVTVFATEAMRSARNAGAMLDAINAKIPDLKIHILAPEVETLLGSMGARSSFVLAKGLFLDLGGGSVQMTYLDTTGPSNRAGQGPSYEVLAAKTGRSMPYGAARLTKILESGDENVQAAETSILKASMRQAFQDLLQNHPALNTVSLPGQSELMHDGDGIDIYLCGGGFRGYGSMLMHNDPTQPYPIPSVATYTVSGSYFGQTKKMLQTNDEYEGKIYGMSKRRRAQFPAIVAVVEAVIEAVPKIRSVTFCGGGNREGFLMMKLPRELRESNPLDLIGVPCSAAGGANSGLEDSLQSVMLTLRSALPHANILSVFTLGLGPVFTRKLWDGIGNESGINASVSLHEAVRQDPGCPGLTHLARAILGLTLCARWAPTSKLLPLDRQIRDGFRRLAGTTDLQASFWAHYIGAVAAVMTTVVPAWPRSPRRVIEAIKFRATSDNENTKLKFRLVISLSLRAAEGLDLPALEKLIREAGKDLPDGKIGKTVAVHIEVLNT